MQTVDISVVICTYNRAQLLREALQHLTRQKTDAKFTYELIVVDDGSTDNTRGIVDELASESEVPVRYAWGKGEGYTHALNVGIAESRGEWIAFFDDDERTDPNWLKELFLSVTEVGAYMAGGPIALAMSKEELLTLGPRARALRGEHPPCCGIGLWSSEPPLPGGGNRILKRTVFDSIGVYDENMLSGGCDMDLVLRARDAGFTNAWAPKAVVLHLTPSYRLKPDYVKWACLRGGSAFAYSDWKRRGRTRTLLVCLARIGYAFFITSPSLLLSWISRSSISFSDNTIQLWRNIGYTRQTLFLVTPTLFSQKRFFDLLNFRKERQCFSETSTLT